MGQRPRKAKAASRIFEKNSHRRVELFVDKRASAARSVSMLDSLLPARRGPVRAVEDVPANSGRSSAGDTTSTSSYVETGSAAEKIVTIVTEPLHSLLEKVTGKPKNTVDFWSLDVEGSEAGILQNTDFSKVEVGVMLIEMNKTPENNATIKKIMREKGFRDVGTSKYNEGRGVEALDHVFVNDEYFRSRNVKAPGTSGGPMLASLVGTPGAGPQSGNCQSDGGQSSFLESQSSFVDELGTSTTSAGLVSSTRNAVDSSGSAADLSAPFHHFTPARDLLEIVSRGEVVEGKRTP